MVENILHDRSDIDEYEAPSRMGPRTNCPSGPPPLGGPAYCIVLQKFQNFTILRYIDTCRTSLLIL